SDRGATIESSAFEEAMLAAPPPKRVTAAPGESPLEPALAVSIPAAQDNSPAAALEQPAMAPAEPVSPAS
ncbi:hypothetical protein, partial [Escherichia coli]|uniref:hypothetical protein n=1 Tax=Escherichia coli TaxID=562 RepID=UPI001954384C